MEVDWLFVLGKNRKYVPDRTRLSSQNKVSGSFKHRHRDFRASLSTTSETGRQDCQTGKVKRSNQQSQHTHTRAHTDLLNSRTLECVHTLKLEGGNFLKSLLSPWSFKLKGQRTVKWSHLSHYLRQTLSHVAWAGPGAMSANMVGSVCSEESRPCCCSSDSFRNFHCSLLVKLFAFRWEIKQMASHVC